MRPNPRFLAAALAATLALAACGGDDDDDDTATDDQTTTTVAGDEGDGGDDGDAPGTATDTTLASEEGTDEPATLGVGETTLGPTVIDADGFTLYVFDLDSDGTSACLEGCVDVWPPLTVEGEPVVGDDIDSAAVTTFTRPDGATQVQLNGMPLYRFSGDAQPGDTNGLGVGEVWWPVTPDGQKIATAQQASTGGGVYDY